MSRFKTTIGLEIHVQLMTKTKMFCSCKTNVLEAEPNTNICPVCTGQPGALPVTNEEAVKLAVKAALLLNAKINEVSRFDRKNYFYPDLPKGYQITQYFYPLAVQGYIEIDGKKIRIRRIHIEEDAGKLLHEGESIEKANYALVDYNRSGVPLIEIVTEPDIESPKEARAFMEKLRSIVRYADISTGDMEKGALRCDANISVLDTETGVRSNRVEVKNMNSFKFVEKALEYERDRIISYLEKGENVPQETRGWDMNSKRTFSMRGKEEEADYRYFPEPDLPPLIITQDYIEEIKKELPELADEKAGRFVREYSIPEYDAKVLSADKDIAEYFEEAAKIVGDAKFVSNWMMTELLRELKERELNIKEVKIKPVHFKELKELISQGIISTSMAKKVFVEVVETGESPSKIVERKGLKKIDDTALIEEILKRVIKENPKTVKKYKNGKTSVLGFFVGQVMKETKGKADPKLVNEIAKKLLDEV